MSDRYAKQIDVIRNDDKKSQDEDYGNKEEQNKQQVEDYQNIQNLNEENQNYSVNFNLEYSLQDEIFFKLPPLTKAWKTENVKRKFLISVSFNKKLKISPIMFNKLLQQLIITLKMRYMNGTMLQIGVKIYYKIIFQGEVINFKFNLPPCGFSQKFPITTYKQNNFVTEQNQQVPLNPQQLAQIKRNGTFEVASQRYPFPYTWQLSAWVMKGREKIDESYINDLSLVYAQTLYMKNRLLSNKISLKKGVQASYKFFKMFLANIVGFRVMDFNYTDSQIHEKLERKRQKRLNQMNQNETAIFQYFSVLNEQNKQELEEREDRINDFDQVWKEFNKIQDKVSFEIDDIYEELNEKAKDEVFEEDKEEIAERKQLKALNRTNILQKYNIVVDVSLPIEQSKNEILQTIQNVFITSSHLTIQEQQHLQHLIEVQKLMRYNKQLSDEQYLQQINEYSAKLKNDHKIKSRVDQFYREKYNEKSKAVSIETNQQLRLKLLNQIQDKYPGQGKLFADYVQTETNYDQIFKNYKEHLINKHEVPSSTFVTHRNLFPPYQVEQYESYGKLQYRLVRKTQYETTTRYYFWRIILFFVRWYGYTLNSMYNLFVFGIVGPLGLRALVGTNAFYPDYECNYNTGVIQKTNLHFQTVLSAFIIVIEGMMNSRERFEGEPDTGIFGKKFARLWNLFEVYIFRFLFVGILCVLILFPIAIIVNFLVTFILALTAWLWIPIFLVLRTLFQWFIYNFDREKWGSKNPVWFPMINLAIRFIIFGLGQIIFALLCMIVIHPGVALFLLCFAHLRAGLRLTYDWIMIYIVKCLGRVPASENNIAWKIAGPGISRQFYNQIQEEDVYVLIYSELEKAVLKQYEIEIKKLLPGPYERANQTVQGFFGAFKAHKSAYENRSWQLENLLNKQISDRYNIFAQYPSNIAFTKQELHHLLINTKKFIKKQIVLKDMKSYIWAYYDVMELDYNQLTRQIWKKAFQNNNILEPFESRDIRMRIETDNTRHITLNLVREALEGTVNLEKEKSPQFVEQGVPEKPIIQVPFVHMENIRNQLVQTQGKRNSWSSHIDQLLSVYLNLSYRKLIN